MEQSIKEGYRHFEDVVGGSHGAQSADLYIHRINEAIDLLERDMNSFKGFQTPSLQLKGDIAEFWHSDTFNINARLNDSQFNTMVDRSHGYASADVTSNWGDKFGFKYLRSGADSAKSQSISHFQRYCNYKSASGRGDLSFHDFITERGLNSDEILNDPIYQGQIRIIPSDQLKEAIEYLKFKIAKESMSRPEQVDRYQNTLENLSSKLKASDGTSSIELSAKEAEELANIAKKGEFNAENYGLSTEDLIKMEHVVKQGLKAGVSAAVITMVLRIAPQIYKCLDELLNSGEVSEEQFKNLGFAALSGSSGGFLRGFISASLVTSCESGILGESLKQVSPSIIAALTVVLYSTMKDSFLVVKGEMSRYELANNLSQNIFVTSCALGLGVLTQVLLPALPGAYLLGNFVGSFIGSFAYIAWDKAFISFCTQSGFTLFGLVEQDYSLPENILREIGIDVFQYEEFIYDECRFDTFEFDEFKGDFISIIRRGVIGIHQVGYIQ